MAHVLADRVKETSTTTGTGTLTLAGAVANFRTFTSVLANGDTTLYAIIHQSANEWEVGLGTFTTSGTTLARTTVLGSSNAGSAVNLSAGTKHVAITLTTAGRIPGIAFTSAVTPAVSDGAALGSGSLNWSDLFLSGGGVISFNNGDVTITHVTNALTVSGGQLTFGVDGNLIITDSDGGLAPMNIAPGILVANPFDGDIEIDATNLYAATDAGNRGYIPVRHLIRANAVRTYTSNTSAQNVFNDPANGRVTLETGTYRFGGVLSWGSMSATSGNRNLTPIGAGTAVATAWVWHAWGVDAATGTAAALGGSHMITSTSPASVVTAAVGTSLIVAFEGSFECSTAGTFQPSTTMVTAAASTLSIGSYMWFERIGDQSRVFVGQWD